MSHPRVRLLVVALLLAGWTSAMAQDPVGGRPGDEYRRLFKKPETTEEYWNAIKFEIEVGQFDLAAKLIEQMLASNPSEQDLVELQKQVGMVPFLRLRLVPRWIPKPDSIVKAVIDQAEADNEAAKLRAEKLIERVTEAVRKHIENPVRIKRYVDRLAGSPEEFKFAIEELHISKGLAVPFLVDAMRRNPGPDRLPYMRALLLLSDEIIPPLVAALDSNIPDLQIDIMEVLRRRGATQATPFLWFVMGWQKYPPEVRLKAGQTLAYFLDLHVSRLPSPTAELVREADRYYKKQIKFEDPLKVVIWRWDGNSVVQGWPPDHPTVPATRAEEYYGLRFAQQALAIDPSHEPAQRVLASLLLDKSHERAGLVDSLSRTAPPTYELLASLSPDMLIGVLETALKEKRVPVILGATRLLGDVKEVKAIQPRSEENSPLVQALNFPDARIRLAAAEAILNVPGSSSANGTSEVVDVFRRTLAMKPTNTKGRIIVGYFDEGLGTRMVTSIQGVGYEAARAASGRDVLRLINESADVDMLIFDSELPDPGLHSLLGQLKADRNASRLPIVLTVNNPERADQLRRFLMDSPNIHVVLESVALNVVDLRTAIQTVLGEHVPLTPEELKLYRERAVLALSRLARGEVQGYDPRPATDAVLQALHAGDLSPAGQSAALQFIGRLPGAKSQSEMLDVLLTATRPKEARISAADELARHVQQHSNTLSPIQIARLLELQQQADLDPELKIAVAKLMGAVGPSSRITGERLLRVQPPPPGM